MDDTIKGQISGNLQNASEVIPQGDAPQAKRTVFRNAALCAAMAAGICTSPVHAGWNGTNGYYSYNSNEGYQQQVYQTNQADMQKAQQAYNSYYQFAIDSESNNRGSLKNGALIAYDKLSHQFGQYQGGYPQQNMSFDKINLEKLVLLKSSNVINNYTASLFAISKLNDAAKQMTGNNSFVHPVVQNAISAMPVDIQPLVMQSLNSFNPNMKDYDRLDWARNTVSNAGIWKQLMADYSAQEIQSNPSQYPSFVRGYNQPNNQVNCNGSFFNGLCNQLQNGQNAGPNFTFNANTRPNQEAGIISDTIRYLGGSNY